MALFTTLFTDHNRTWQSNHYVYPVVSRRSRGLSIGINLNPDKVCNFDCVYCSVDRTQPSPSKIVDLDNVESELEKLFQLTETGELFRRPPFDQTPPEFQRLNDIAFSGDGEPTSCSQFPQACQRVANVLRRHSFPTPPKIVLITNATLLHRPAVKEALSFLDDHNGEIWAKLDAGTEDHYQKVERTAVPFSRVLENILLTGRDRPIVIQSLFMNLHDVGPRAEEVEAYVDRLRELLAGGCQIKQVQVYTVARETAEKWVTPLDDRTLDQIAGNVRKTGLNVDAFYGPG